MIVELLTAPDSCRARRLRPSDKGNECVDIGLRGVYLSMSGQARRRIG